MPFRPTLCRWCKNRKDTTTSALDFPGLFSYGCYGGLAGCMVATTINALYTAWGKRGTTRQLALVIVCCVGSALLLLPALLWFNTRFSTAQTPLSTLEITLVLIYVALFGCVVPFSSTTVYCLFTRPRNSNTAVRIPRPRSKRTTKGNAAAAGSSYAPPHREPGVPPPLVYGEDTPWGWIEYRNGRFQGQKLALKRSIITIGREEDNDIWLDDDTSSRYHAELSWQNGLTLLTDRDSLNGVLLNGRRIRGSVSITSGDRIEIGEHRFFFELASHTEVWTEQNDPLSSLRRPSSAGILPDDDFLPFRRPAGAPALPTRPLNDPVTPQPMLAASLPTSLPAICVFRNGALVGTSFLIDRPMLTVGSAASCDVHIEDGSISIEQARFSHTPGGDYLFGVGVRVNDELLREPHQLVSGDLIYLGAACMEYTLVPEMKTTPLPQPQLSGPMHLRLPSKPK